MLVIVAAIVFAMKSARAGDRRLLAALGWFAVTFAPASNLLTATPQILTERTLYGPSIGVIFALAALLGAMESRWQRRASRTTVPLLRATRLAAVGAAIVLIIAAGRRTLAATAVWRSNDAVFGQMIAADPNGYRGYWLAAGQAKNTNRVDESLVLLEHAYRLYPRDRQLVADYAQALLDGHQPARAVAVARVLMSWPELRKEPSLVALYLNTLGQTYGPDSVIRAADTMFASGPKATTSLFVGAAHEARGDVKAAEASYQAGLRIAPADTSLRRRLASLRERGLR
jgi:hypothetical protein